MEREERQLEAYPENIVRLGIVWTPFAAKDSSTGGDSDLVIHPKTEASPRMAIRKFSVGKSPVTSYKPFLCKLH
jgi:hypothetical protein